MPARAFHSPEREAVEVVRREEVERGWRPGRSWRSPASPSRAATSSARRPTEARPTPVEVKRSGESLLRPSGAFSYPADINHEQLERAQRDPHFRLEILANLTAARRGEGRSERLTLTAAEVVERARPWKHRVALEGLADRVRSA
ncbi:MAG: hypothetical protein M3N16_07320 [Actinomycetota bacterium]|nr:hypothetical protein [Actinomycetota bacterium]